MPSHRGHQGKVISHDLIRVEPRDPRNRGWIYAFLRSRYARQMMRSTHYGSVIKHLETVHMDEIPVLPLEGDLRDDYNRDFDAIVTARGEAHERQEEAYAILGERVGRPTAHVPSEASFATTSGSLVAGSMRLDAFFYNPRATALAHHLSSIGVDTAQLGTLVQDVVLPNRFTRVFGTKGVSYLDSEDIFKTNPEITKKITSPPKHFRRDYMVREGWLLMARSGQIYGLNGSVTLAGPHHEGRIVSEHIIRIVPKREASVDIAYLLCVLSHPVLGRPLVTRLAFGTEVPEIAPEDVKRIPVIRLDQATENDISDLMHRSMRLRNDATTLEQQLQARAEKFLRESLQLDEKLIEGDE